MRPSTTSPRRALKSAITGAAVAALATGALAAVAEAAPTGPNPFAGGSNAPSGAYPFVAGVRDPGTTRFFCTGSLVDPNWVLTAAHCVDDRSTAEVVIGDTNLNDTTDPAEIRTVDQIRINPRWGGDTGDKHDLAMLHLGTPSTLPPVTFGVTKQLADAFRRCAQQRVFAMTSHTWNTGPCRVGTGVALGWGRTPSSGNGTSLTLKQVRPAMYDLAPKTFWRVKAGACPGDSGGPLMIAQPGGTLTQIGVASYAQHGGGWFDWLVGGRCSTKGWDFYADAAGTDAQVWIKRTIDPPPPLPPGPPSCANPTKPICNPDEL